MRRIVMFNRVTMDGAFSGPGGDLGWAVPDDELDAEGASSTPGSGAMIFGRVTYDMFESFWPKAVDASGTTRDPHTPGRQSANIHRMGVWINEATKIVFSRTRKDVTWKNSRLIRELDPGVVRALKEEPGKDIMLFGSGSIVRALTEHGLIDEYVFIVTPLFLAGGKPLLAGLGKSTKLELAEAKAFSSGNVRLRYTPKR